MSPSHDREEPPEWGNNPLSFFRDAEYNARVTAVKLPAVYELLQRVHTLFRKFKDLIAKDPKGTQPAQIWLRRNEDAIAKSRCKSEFTVTKLRQTHEALDPDTAADLHKIYEDLIDFGAHPNQFGALQRSQG